MKKLILLFALTILVIPAFAQDSTAILTYQKFYATTMTGTKDTLDFTWGSDRSQFSYIMLSAVSSATDTLRVYTLGEDGVTWTPCGVTGISTGTTAAFINATTAGQKYTLTDPLPNKIRIVYESDDGATCAISLSGVYVKE